VPGETIDWRVSQAERDIETLYTRTGPVGEHERRLETVEESQKTAIQQRSEDRTEFLSEIKELRRTIIQATLAILVAMIAAIVTFSQIAGSGAHP
jgi:guanylate kinase